MTKNLFLRWQAFESFASGTIRFEIHSEEPIDQRYYDWINNLCTEIRLLALAMDAAETHGSAPETSR